MSVPSYASRFFTKVRRETTHFIKHKLLTGACVAVTALTVRLALWHFHQTSLTWSEVWTNVLIIVGSFAVVVLGVLVVNLFRAPALLDRERTACHIDTFCRRNDSLRQISWVQHPPARI